MNTKSEIIENLNREIPLLCEKCKKTWFKPLKMYRIGKLYIYNELYRRFTGKEFDVSSCYFTQANKCVVKDK